MAEQNPDVIEQEIALLEQQLADRRAQLGQDTAAPYERAEVHAALGERIGQEGAAPAAVSPPTTQSTDLPSWQDPALAVQVQQLVDVAFTKGVAEAIAQAAKTGNAALVDAFHDIMADELHAELLSRSKLEPAA